MTFKRQGQAALATRPQEAGVLTGWPGKKTHATTGAVVEQAASPMPTSYYGGAIASSDHQILLWPLSIRASIRVPCPLARAADLACAHRRGLPGAHTTSLPAHPSTWPASTTKPTRAQTGRRDAFAKPTSPLPSYRQVPSPHSIPLPTPQPSPIQTPLPSPLPCWSPLPIHPRSPQRLYPRHFLRH